MATITPIPTLTARTTEAASASCFTKSGGSLTPYSSANAVSSPRNTFSVDQSSTATPITLAPVRPPAEEIAPATASLAGGREEVAGRRQELDGDRLPEDGGRDDDEQQERRDQRDERVIGDCGGKERHLSVDRDVNDAPNRVDRGERVCGHASRFGR